MNVMLARIIACSKCITFDIFDGRTLSTSCIQYTFDDIYLFTTIHGAQSNIDSIQQNKM